MVEKTTKTEMALRKKAIRAIFFQDAAAESTFEWADLK